MYHIHLSFWRRQFGPLICLARKLGNVRLRVRWEAVQAGEFFSISALNTSRGCRIHAESGGPSMAARNAELSRRIFEDVWNRKNLSAVDEIISADYVHHDPSSPAVPSAIDGYKQFVNSYMTAFPDAHFTIDDAFTDSQNTEVHNEVTR